MYSDHQKETLAATPVKKDVYSDHQKKTLTTTPVKKDSGRQTILDSEKEERKQRELISISLMVKPFLKPAFNKDRITKEEYKGIMKKCMMKIYEHSKTNDIKPHNVEKLVLAYIDYCIRKR